MNQLTETQFDLLKHGIYSTYIPTDKKDILPSKVSEGKYEGVETKIWEKIAEEKEIPKNFKDFVKEDICTECHGDKLNALSRSATVHHYNIPYIAKQNLKYILAWIKEISQLNSEQAVSLVKDYLLDIETKIKRISKLGLDYLSLDRQYSTLSGGEAQRIKLSAVLDSKMTELIIILDEPTIGLHASDTEGLISMINEIKKRNNTVIVIEHDDTFIRHADFVVEIGPASGDSGGEILATGSYDNLHQNSNTLLTKSADPYYQQVSYQRNTTQKAVEVQEANQHNLKIFL